MDPHIKDQVDAASAEQERHFTELHSWLTAIGRVHGGITQPANDKFEIALRRCKPCPHLVHPQPVYALFGIDRVVCSACLGVAVEQYKADPGQNCDLCGNFVPDNWFIEFTIRSGPLIGFGNRGRCCDDVQFPK